MKKKPGVNEKCPCGSGKKYKKCFLTKSKDCSLYLKEKEKKISDDYFKITEEVLKNLGSLHSDLKQLFYENKDGYQVVPDLMKLIGIFTTIDVLGNYWYEYLGKTGSTSSRFDEFVNNFCFTEKNEKYLNKKYLGNITTENLRKLRNNIVHFYGLGIVEKDKRYCILPDISKHNSQRQNDRTVHELLKLDKNCVFIKPLELADIVIEGAMIMCEGFVDEAKAAKSEERLLQCLKGMERIFNKVNNEGKKDLSAEMADNIWGPVLE